MSHAETVNRVIFPWSILAPDRLKPQTVTSFFTIALSREAGTGGTEVAHEVGTRLGWPVYDHELMERIALDAGIRASLLESVDEHRESWLKEAFEGLFGVPYVSEPAYVHQLVKTVRALGAHGECVIVGRGAAFILPVDSTLRVRLVAPSWHRIATLSQRLGIDQAKAKEKILALDKERTGFVREYFQHDPRNPHYYDLVLNTARFSVAECSELIVEGLLRWQAREFARSSEPSAV
jgi:cytidylate kinase